MKKVNIAIIFLILFSVLFSAYFYQHMPEKIATHWNIKGEADGYSDKAFGMFLFPVISVVMLIIFLIIPKIDPLKKNIEKFRNYFDYFILFIISFFVYIQVISTIWNQGYEFNMTIAMMPALSILFFYMGFMVENAKRNWFIGIRTPWTLSSDKVWDKTHKLGGKLYKIAGIITLAGLFFIDYLFWFLIVPIIGFSLYLIVYSYIEYKKEKN